jgi:transcription antitermination factor NusG
MAIWMVARNAPQMDRRVEDTLTRRGVVSYFPRFKSRETGRRGPYGNRPDFQIKPLFPTYFFAITDEWYSLKNITGVIGVIVNGDGYPARSAKLDASIALLQTMTDEYDLINLPPPLPKQAKFKDGDRVRALAGLFRDGTGICSSTSPEGRVRVLFDMLGADVGVVLDESDLASAGAAR